MNAAVEMDGDVESVFGSTSVGMMYRTSLFNFNLWKKKLQYVDMKHIISLFQLLWTWTQQLLTYPQPIGSIGRMRPQIYKVNRQEANK